MYTLTQLNHVPILDIDPAFNKTLNRFIEVYGNKPFIFWYQYINSYQEYNVKQTFRNTAGYELHLTLLKILKSILTKYEIVFEVEKYTAKNQKPFEKLKIIRNSDSPVKTLDIKILEAQLHYLKSAQKRSLDYNLTRSDIRLLLTRKTCYYTGELLTDDNRTVDRIDNRKGYVKGNVVACTWKANNLKEQLFESRQIPSKFLKRIIELMEKGIII